MSASVSAESVSPPIEQKPPRYEYNRTLDWKDGPPPEWTPPITDMRILLDIDACRTIPMGNFKKPELARLIRRGKIASAVWDSLSDEVKASVEEEHRRAEEKKRKSNEALSNTMLANELARMDEAVKKLLDAIDAEFGTNCLAPGRAERIAALLESPEVQAAKARRDAEKAAVQSSERKEAQTETIQIIEGQRATNVAKLAKVLGASGKYFRRGGQLVRLAAYKTADVDRNGTKRAAGSIVIKQAEVPAIVADVSRYAMTEKYDGRKKRYVDCDLPNDVANSVKEIGAEDASINDLLGIVHVPILRPDGTLVTRRGYDPETRLYLAADVNVEVPENPTLKDAQDAAAWLMKEIYGEFKTDAIGYSVMLSSLLTAILRPYLNGSPLHAFSAPSYGAGKSKCAEIVGVVVLGVEPPMTSPGHDNVETMKRVDSAIRAGDPINTLDNVSQPLTGDALCVALTAQKVSVRVMGTNMVLLYDSACFWMVTGQNLVIGDDLVRRSVLATIDPGVERPELTEFKKSDLVGWVKENRLLILSKLYTIIRAHSLVGLPSDQKLGSFEDWARRVAGLITWLGYVSPKASQDTLYANDNRRNDLITLLDAIYDWQQGGPKAAEGGENSVILRDEANAGKPWVAKDLIDLVAGDLSGHQAIADFVKGLKAPVPAHALGNYFRRILGKVTGGKKLIVVGQDPSTKSRLYKVVVVSEDTAAANDEGVVTGDSRDLIA